MTAPLNQQPTKERIVELDFHGLVGIRLVGPSYQDVAIVRRQLGPLEQGPLTRNPDITIKFENDLPLPHLKYLGLNNCGYNKDGFYILRSQKQDAKVRIPFDAIGGPCVLVCETGLRRVPLLTAILNVTLIKKGYVPLHASAFVYEGNGILVTGWSKGGKTEALLAFAKHGASYVGDEWVLLSKDGTRIYGLPEPVTVWDWQIQQLPYVRQHVSRMNMLAFKGVRALENAERRLSRGAWRRTLPVSLLGKAIPPLVRQLHVNIPPDHLFGFKSVPRCSFNKLFLVMSREEQQISVEPCDADEVAGRMASSVHYELLPLYECYYTFKFAFPHLNNAFLECVPQRHAELLQQAFHGKQSYRVMHPYPVDLEDLYKHMVPYCTSNDAAEA